MQIPETKYARIGDLRIAFQEWGAGPRTIVIPPLVSNIDIQWDHELYRRMLEHLGAHLQMIHFDKRGIGLSDRFERPPTLDERIEDITAVLDTAGWEQANIIGVSEGALMAQHFALKFPERADRLVLLSGAAPSSLADRVVELSGAAYRPLEERIADFRRIAETWGEDAEPFVRLMAPSQIDNPSYMRWVNRFNRGSATPSGFRRQLESVMLLDADVASHALSAPTLVVGLTDDRVLAVGHGRVLAETIPDVTYVEVEGADHFLVTLPNWREVMDPVIEFLTGTMPSAAVDRRFATVLFTDIVDSTKRSGAAGDRAWAELIDEHDAIVHRAVDGGGGRVVKSTGDGVLAIFDTPSRAVDAVRSIKATLESIGIPIRAGLHAGEIQVHADSDISGLAVNLAARVEAAADDGAIFVSSTIRDMLLGSDVTLEDRGEHTLKGIDGSWRLFEAT